MTEENLTFCPFCGGKLDKGAVFCAFCGAKAADMAMDTPQENGSPLENATLGAVPKTCPVCGSPLSGETVFCDHCGSRVDIALSPPAASASAEPEKPKRTEEEKKQTKPEKPIISVEPEKLKISVEPEAHRVEEYKDAARKAAPKSAIFNFGEPVMKKAISPSEQEQAAAVPVVEGTEEPRHTAQPRETVPHAEPKTEVLSFSPNRNKSKPAGIKDEPEPKTVNQQWPIGIRENDSVNQTAGKSSSTQAVAETAPKPAVHEEISRDTQNELSRKAVPAPAPRQENNDNRTAKTWLKIILATDALLLIAILVLFLTGVFRLPGRRNSVPVTTASGSADWAYTDNPASEVRDEYVETDAQAQQAQDFSIHLSSTDSALFLRDSCTLHAYTANSAEIIWTTDNPNVATVADGVVTAVGPGRAIITAAANDTSEQCSILVWDSKENQCGDNVYWLLKGGTLTISGFGDMWDYGFFENEPPWDDMRDQIERVEIQNGVSGIGECAFSGFDSVTKVTISDNVTVIGADALYHCWQLANVVIGCGVVEIGETAFGSCPELTQIIVDPRNPVYIGENGMLCSRDKKTLYACPGAGWKDGSFIVPKGITTIKSGAFECCLNLKELTISSDVTAIETKSFEYCWDLCAINVEPSNQAYASVDGVLYTKDLKTLIKCPAEINESFVIPASVTTIEANAFGECRIEEVYFAGSEEAWEMINIHYDNQYLFYATVHFNAYADGSI